MDTLRRFSCCALCCFLGLSCVSLTVAADTIPSGAVQLSSAQTVAIFGQTISAKYQKYDGVAVQWGDTVFTYDHTETISACSYYAPSGQDFTNRTVCWYACTSSAGLTQNTAYPTFKLQVDKTLSDFDYFDFGYTAFVSSLSFSSPISALAESKITCSAGDSTPFVASSADTAHYGSVSFNGADRLACGVVTTSSPCYVDEFICSDLQDNYGIYWFGIVAPVVSSGYSSESGDHTQTLTTSGGGSGSGGDYGGQLDNIEQGISGLPAAILSGLQNLFVPDDEFLADWVDQQETFLSDHLGALYDAGDLLTDFIALFSSVQPSHVLNVPTVTIPLKNNNFVLGGWTVEAKLQGFESVYTALALMIDFLAAAGLISMLHRKLKLFLTPEAESIKE